MKNILYVLLAVFTIGCVSNKIPEHSQNEKGFHKINDRYTFTIKEILSDSRCPKDVQCVWEGQVELVISFYENERFLKEELIVLNTKNFEKNRSILEQYTLNKKISRIQIFPEKIQNKEIELKDYFLEITVEGQD